MAFTTEKEANGQLPFLDILVTKTNGQLSTSVFRKETYTGLGLSFFSFSPFIYKVNSIKTLLHRAKSVCSNFTALNREFSFLVEYFHMNGYSKYLIYKHIGHFISKIQNPAPPIHSVAKRKMFVSFPYHGVQAEKMKIEIMQLVEKIFPQINLHLAFSNRFTIGSLFPHKESLPPLLRSNVIYKYSCARCASGTYVGSTVRNLYMRIAEHRGRHFRTGNMDKNPKASAIRDHALKCGGGVSPDNFSIIGYEKTENHLRILESLQIFHQKSSLNEMKSAFPLSIIR